MATLCPGTLDSDDCVGCSMCLTDEELEEVDDEVFEEEDAIEA